MTAFSKAILADLIIGDLTANSVLVTGDVVGYTIDPSVVIEPLQLASFGYAIIALDPGQPGANALSEPAFIQAIWTTGGVTDRSVLELESPDLGNGHSQLTLYSDSFDGTSRARVDIDAEGSVLELFAVSADRVAITGDELRLTTPSNSFIVTAGGYVHPAMRFLSNENLVDESVAVTSYTAETNAAALVFTAPPSGIVEIEVSANIDIETSLARAIYVGWEIRNGGTIGSGTVALAATDENCAKVGTGSVRTIAISSRTTQVSGLTAGNQYNVRTMKKIDATTSIVQALIRDRRLKVRPSP